MSYYPLTFENLTCRPARKFCRKAFLLYLVNVVCDYTDTSGLIDFTGKSAPADYGRVVGDATGRYADEPQQPLKSYPM